MALMIIAMVLILGAIVALEIFSAKSHDVKGYGKYYRGGKR